MVFLFLVVVGGTGTFYRVKEKQEEKERLIALQEEKEREEKRQEEFLVSTRGMLDALYTKEGIPQIHIDSEELTKVLQKIEEIPNEESRQELQEKVNQLNAFRLLEERIDSLFQNNVLKSTYTVESIQEIKEACSLLPEDWQEVFSPSITEIERQKGLIETAKKNVDALFSDKKMTKVKGNVTRTQYNKAKKSVENLVQKDLVTEYTPYLEKVLKVVEEQEEAKRKEEEAKNV